MAEIDPVELLRQLVQIPSVNPMGAWRASGPVSMSGEREGNRGQISSEPTKISGLSVAGKLSDPLEAQSSGEGQAAVFSQEAPSIPFDVGGSGQEDIFYEARLTNFLEKFCQGLGLETFRQSVGPGRENLLVRLLGHPPPEEGGQILLWDAHQDTVPTGQMPRPFAAQVREGRLYGRGACDVKGGLAAMLAALARLVSEGNSAASGTGGGARGSVSPSLGRADRSVVRAAQPRVAPAVRRPTVYLAATVDEEHGMSGVRALCQWWETGAEGVFPRRPDAAVVAEPTELHVVVAHKGVVRWRCHTRGLACHSSRPQEGENAIYRMAEVVQALQQYAEQVVPPLACHPLCGRPSLSVGRIYGGQSVNIVPDLCTIEIDRRLTPGESPQQAWEHACRYLLGCLPQPEHLKQDPPFVEIPALSEERNGPWAETLANLCTQITGREPRRIGVDYATHASFYAQAGVPTVVFGPGSIQQAHTADEWIALDQLIQASEILYRLVKNWYPTG